MKKIFIIMMLSFCFSWTMVKAETTTARFNNSFIGSYHYVDSQGKYGDFEKITRQSDGEIAYCIEPGVALNNENYSGVYQDLDSILNATNISRDQLEKISLYAYFGYGYENHNTVDWIVATQSLIWQELGRVFWFTSFNNHQNPQDSKIDTPMLIQENMQELTNLVNNYLRELTLPNDLKIFFSEEYTISDDALNNYQVVNCENCTATIDDGTLKINPQGTEAGKVILTKNFSSRNHDFIIYTHSTGQDVIVPGMGLSETIELPFQILTGKITIHKYDMDSKLCEPKEGGSLAGAVYKIFNADDIMYVGSLTIGDDCSASFNGLPKGNYYFYESNGGKGYSLDKNNYNFVIDENNYDLSFEVYDKRYLGQVQIHKFDSITKNCQPNGFLTLKNAVYGLYRVDGLFYEELTTDELCFAKSKRNLELGGYYLQEIKAPFGFKIDNEKHYFEVNRDNADGLIEIDLEDEAYKTNLIINKMYAHGNQKYPEIDAEFGIYDKKTNELLHTLTINEEGRASVSLPLGEYIIRQLKGKEGYQKVEDFDLILDRLEDTNTYISLIDEEMKVNLKIRKVDELGNALAIKGIKFKLYDTIKEEYVCSQINYPNSHQICEYETDEHGEVIIPAELGFSTYRIEEIDSFIPGYLWNKEGLTFTIDESTMYQENDFMGPFIEIDFANESVKGQITIIKKAQDSGIPLANALFEIYKENGELLVTESTDEEGKIHLTNLPYGKYYIIEKVAPEGYIIQSEPIYFEIIDNNLLEIVIENEAYEIPETYLHTNYGFLGGSLILLVWGIRKIGKKNN